MRRRIIACSFAAVISAAGVITWWLVPIAPAPAEAAASPAIPVVTAKVGVSDMPLVKVGLGTVTAYNTVNIHSQVTGTIQKIGFVEGQTVQPGNLIAQLDPRPFQAALQQAGTYGAVTIGVANNPATVLLTSAKFPVLVETGRELIAGSTRMKAGTAQKIVLNLISTGIMLRLGRVYRGMMVNMQTTNAKLKRRAEVMVARIAGCGHAQAACALEQTEGDIKMATLVALGYDKAEAERILARHKGNLRRVFADLT